MKKITNKELRTACERYGTEANTRVAQIEEIFLAMEVKAAKFPSAAVRGLVEDAEWIGRNFKPGAVADAGIAAVMRQVQRYELTLYVEATSWSDRLDLRTIADILAEAAHELEEDIHAFDGSIAVRVDDLASGDDEHDDDDENNTEIDEEGEEEKEDGDEDEDEDENKKEEDDANPRGRTC